MIGIGHVLFSPLSELSALHSVELLQGSGEQNLLLLYSEHVWMESEVIPVSLGGSGCQGPNEGLCAGSDVAVSRRA